MLFVTLWRVGTWTTEQVSIKAQERNQGVRYAHTLHQLILKTREALLKRGISSKETTLKGHEENARGRKTL